MRLVLASASPRRADLLRSAGFTFEVLAVDADERPRPSEPPAAYVRRLAGEKSARALDILSRSRAGFPPLPKVSARLAEARLAREGGSRTVEDDIAVLGADTAVIVEGGFSASRATTRTRAQCCGGSPAASMRCSRA